jgi:hypothetical protein
MAAAGLARVATCLRFRHPGAGPGRRPLAPRGAAAGGHGAGRRSPLRHGSGKRRGSHELSAWSRTLQWLLLPGRADLLQRRLLLRSVLWGQGLHRGRQELLFQPQRAGGGLYQQHPAVLPQRPLLRQQPGLLRHHRRRLLSARWLVLLRRGRQSLLSARPVLRERAVSAHLSEQHDRLRRVEAFDLLSERPVLLRRPVQCLSLQQNPVYGKQGDELLRRD